MVARLVTQIDQEGQVVGLLPWPKSNLPNNCREYEAADGAFWDALPIAERAGIETTLRGFLEAEVNDERQRRACEVRVFQIPGYGVPVHVSCSDGERHFLAGLSQRAERRTLAGNAALSSYRDQVNFVHQLTAAQVVVLADLVSDWVEWLHLVSWQMKDGPAIPEDFQADHHWQIPV